MRLLFYFLSGLFCCWSLFLDPAFAYPNFIGYGYNSCMTCHYNGQGGGALNDYGRALFATEISARHVYPEIMEEEQVAAQSSFLGTRELPWWIRPGLKHRSLWFQNNPGSKAHFDRFYNMQNEINLNLFFDKSQRYSFITTAGYTVYPRSFGTSREEKTPYWFAKEYYLRWQTGIKNFWVYAGLMDKVFGLRHPDHTAVNRGPIGLGQFDQSQGFVLDYSPTKWNVAMNLFFGHTAEKSEVRQKGFSLFSEYEMDEKFRAGGSILKSKSEQVEWTRLAAFSRLGVGKGSALMMELGLAQNKSLLTGAGSSTTGAYTFVESWIALRRGYNLVSTLEYSKADIQKVGTEKMRWSLGGVMFPLPRTEIRTMLVNNKNTTPSVGVPDNWQIQMQLHLSL